MEREWTCTVKYLYKILQIPKFNVSRLVCQMALPNPVKPGGKSRMKMWLEQRRQVMLQLHLSDQQFYWMKRYGLWWYIEIWKRVCLASEWGRNVAIMGWEALWSLVHNSGQTFRTKWGNMQNIYWGLDTQYKFTVVAIPVNMYFKFASHKIIKLGVTHWSFTEMTEISQTTFENTLIWLEICCFSFQILSIFFPLYNKSILAQTKISNGWNNGLSPIWRRAIIQTNDGSLAIGPSGTNFSAI